MGRAAWWATVHGVTKGQTELSDELLTLSALHFGLCSSLLMKLAVSI